MSKPLKEMTYDELVEHVTAQLFDGLITGGAAELKSRVHLWLSQAIQWHWEREQDERKGTISAPRGG